MLWMGQRVKSSKWLVWTGSHQFEIEATHLLYLISCSETYFCKNLHSVEYRIPFLDMCTRSRAFEMFQTSGNIVKGAVFFKLAFLVSNWLPPLFSKVPTNDRWWKSNAQAFSCTWETCKVLERPRRFCNTLINLHESDHISAEWHSNINSTSFIAFLVVIQVEKMYCCRMQFKVQNMTSIYFSMMFCLGLVHSVLFDWPVPERD